MSSELSAKCACAQCGNHVEFPMEWVGSEVTCPHCKQPTVLTPEAPPETRTVTASHLLTAFTGPIAPTRVSWLYKLNLVLVAFTMALLPVLYLALIGMLAWGVIYWGYHFGSLLFSHWGALLPYLAQMFLYVALVCLGTILIFFMIKPLFAKPARKSQPLSMNPVVEPTLYAFIAKICDLVGAPMPARIDLDCNVNAAAGFRRSAAGDQAKILILVIGVPLVAGLTLREFAGVIAHEFGHLAQGFGMRFTHFIRRVNGWFASVVYDKDEWDVALEEWSEDTRDVQVMFIAGCLRLLIDVPRFVLKMLMYIGHGVCCLLLRQMEYDADSYEIKVAGSAAFETAMQRLVILNEAAGKGYKEMRVGWNLNRKLPDNFPAYVLLQEAKIPPGRRRHLLDTLGMGRTRWFDSHPADGDRIRRARKAAEPGVVHLDLPAAVLFSNFEAISKQISYLHYGEDLEIPVDPAYLRPVEKLKESPA